MNKNAATNDAAPRRVVPASDILEREEGFHILLDVPGVARDGISIEVEENELTVRGSYARDETGGARLVHREFGGVEYARSFTLTDMVDRENIAATLNHGVLDLFLPRAAAAKPRRIEVSG